MLKNILIVSKSHHSFYKVQSELKKESQFFSYHVDSAKRVLEALASNYFDAVVFSFSDFNNKQMDMIDSIALHYKLPIMITATEIDEDAKKRVLTYKRMVIVNVEEERESVNGLLLKLLTGEQFCYRSNPRFRTFQYASLITDRASKDFDKNAAIINLSVSGARVYSKDKEFHVGDHVTLKVPVPFSEKFRNVKARICWREAMKKDKQSNFQAQWNYGLEFLA